jgi:hypothetical protein
MFLFFCNTARTNNNYHFQTLLTLISIFLIHQCVHFWGASTTQSGSNRPERSQFSKANEVRVLKKQGNFNNVRICNGKVSKVLANESGVLAVECLPNNGQVSPPVDDLTFNISFAIPRDHHTSDSDGTDQGDEIRALLEIRALRGQGIDTNVTITPTADGNIIAVSDAGANTGFTFYF